MAPDPRILHVAFATFVDAADLLRRLLAEVTGSGGHELVRRCGACAGPHGKPEVRGGEAHVSLSRTGTLVVVAVTAAGPVGVDVETDEATSFAGFAGVALAPGERAGTVAQRARLWTAKEAVLKAAGVGLTVDPRAVRVRGHAVDWPAAPGPVQLLDVPSPVGTTCTAAVLTDRRPRVRLVDGDALLSR